MKVLSITTNKATQIGFKGYFVSGESHKNAALNSGRRIENTLLSHHPYLTDRYYYANPLEKIVPDSIKERVDLVIYDDEPALFDFDKELSKVYFFPSEKHNEKYFSDKLQKFREYFYRLEMMDRGAVKEYEEKLSRNMDVKNSKEKIFYFNSHIADAQYNQETAAVCENFYKESQELRDAKNKYSKEIADIKKRIKETEEKMESVFNEEDHWENIGCILKDNFSDPKKQKALLESIINSFKEENQEIINNLNEELAKKSKLLEQAKKDLIPHFEKIKNYFMQRGVKTIR